MSKWSDIWDKRNKPPPQEPSGKFYAFCFGLGSGMVIGMIMMVVFLL